MTPGFTPLLRTRHLMKQYGGRNGCRDVSFDLYPGEVLCIVGESGSGKTTLLNTLALRTEADSGALDHVNANGVSLDVERGECVVLVGPSGAGKSTFLRCLYGNCLASGGSIASRDDAARGQHLEITGAQPHDVLRLRRNVVGYVSQFLRVIPRVSTIDIVAAPLVSRGVDEDEARDRAAALLARLNVPQRLWPLAPATFSGGEQQRVNIARGLIAQHRVLLLDEPTASLDTENRAVVASLIVEARERGAAIVGVFHDEDTRGCVATRVLALSAPQASASVAEMA